MRFYPYKCAMCGQRYYIMCETFRNVRSALHLFLLAAFPVALLTTGCGTGRAPGEPVTRTESLVATAEPSRAATEASGVPLASPRPGNADLPTGFPLDPSQVSDAAAGARGARVIETGAGKSVRDVSVRDQVSSDAVVASASGWNCRVHVEYEGAAAVDWYLPPGTPVFATMDGDATLIINTVQNAFDYYSADREPYLGDPDRARAPVTPFPGPSGGMGVYAIIVNAAFRTSYGHLDLTRTLALLTPVATFRPPYTPTYDYASAFAAPQPSSAGAQVLTWPVRKGDLIGYSGDSGYSEAPHLHYTVARRAKGETLCPTSEGGFTDGGWLMR